MTPGARLWHWLAAPLAGIVIGPLPATVIAEEPPRPSPAMLLAVRKEADAPCDEPGTAPVPEHTLGTLLNTHTGEATVLSADEPSVERLSSLMADRVTASQVPVDPKLLELLRSLAGPRSPVKVEIVSGYRSWKLNELLRKKGRRVASHSQHSQGMAVDFRIEGMSTSELRKEIETSGWNGGVGYYPKRTDRFVHADTGPKRSWTGH